MLPQAGTGILVCADMEKGESLVPEMHLSGCNAAIQNILLAAHDMGLGAVWLGIAPEKDRMAAVDVALGSPRGVTPFALIAVGHPEHKPEPKGPTRYDETRVHWI